MAEPFRRCGLSGSPLSPPLDTHLAGFPLLRALPGPAAVWVCDCWLISPERPPLPRDGHFLTGKEMSAHTERNSAWLLLCLSGGANEPFYAFLPEHPNLRLNSTSQGLVKRFLHVQPAAPNRLKD